MPEPQIGCLVTRRIVGRDEPENAMRSVLVVVTNEGPQHSFEVAMVDDEQMVETLGPDGADPAFREGVGHRRPHWSADDPGAD